MAQTRNNPTMDGKLQLIFELLREVQGEISQVFELQNQERYAQPAGPPATFKALDAAWQAVQTAAKHIDKVR